MLRHRALNDAARRAFVFLPDGENEGANLTFAQLDERARLIAARLQTLADPGDRALLLYPPGLEFMAAFFGCLYAGVIAVPSYPPKRNRTDTRLQTISADAGARLVLTDQTVLAEIEKRLQHTPELKALHWLATDALDAASDSDWSEPNIRPSDLAFLQYTSGSTTTPKGVMVSHRNLLVTLDDLDRGWDHTPESVMVTWLPIFHDMGLIYGALMPLYKGFTCVMLPPPAFLQGPSRWLRAITRYRGTHSAAPNFAYDLCVASTTPEQRAGFDLRSWHLSLNAAEPVRAETLAAFNEAFAPCGLSPLTVSPGYGLAEASLKVCALPRGETTRLCYVVTDELARHRVVPAQPGAPGVQPIVGCGRGQVDNRYCIVDPETCRLCEPREVGEIWFSGPSVAQGYWGRAAETEACFGAHIAGTGDGPFLRTGDLGFIDEGEIFITGRLKDLIIIRGLNYYPQDIELSVEKSHPSLRPAGGAAFSIEVDGNEVLVVVQEVERTHLRRLNLDEVVSAIRGAVSEKHELPVHAVALLRPGTIPKTSSGKVRRRACRALFLDGQLELVGEWRLAAAPGTEPPEAAAAPPAEHALENAVIETWLSVQISRRLKLPATAIDPREPFSRYGLDSLAAVELSGELEKWLGRHLPPTLLYDYPSIRLLAEHLTAVACEPLPPDEAPVDPAAGPVAIIGIGCRFPGADSPEAFWRLLAGGVDAIGPVPPVRWRADGDPATRWGGFLGAVDGFDAEFFGIAPREADLMDPQQRLLLEVGWEALEDAGLAPDLLGGSRSGVFIGISGSDYARLIAERSGGSDAYSGTGSALSIAANRLSYILDLRGPSWAVDTACSSSLVAVHQACRSLRSGECTMALAGGVNLLLAPDLTSIFARAGMLAPDGRCKAFDASADGYVRGEGCGMVVLKRLADAQRDGDRILAVIRGTAVNQDGRSNGLTAPNGPAQQAVLRGALRDAHLVPSAISYIEAHGTGTALGDPIEVNSLKGVLLEGRAPSQHCWIGSVKTNVGHLEAAAGIAGLIKVVLALRHRKIPPHLHLRKLNPLIALDGRAFTVPDSLTDWPAADGTRIAGVSSFGFGGTNAHVVVGEAPPTVVAASAASRGGEVLVLSARTEAALRQLAARYDEMLCRGDAPAWSAVCRTAALGRVAMPQRLAVFAAHGAEAAERLAAFARGEAPAGLCLGSVGKRPRIAFLFSGQGSLYPGVGLELYATSPVYRAAFDECRALVSASAGWELLEVVASDDRISRTEFGQVALFAVQYAIGKLWAAWGVVPDAVAGHSIGEYAAACVAGVLSLDEAVRLIVVRGRLMAEHGGSGAMAAVQGTEADVAAVLARHGVEIGAVNSPRQVVLTGSRTAVSAAASDLKAAGLRVNLLEVERGYHSREMEPILAAFGDAAAGVGFRAPQCAFVSSVTGGAVREELTDPGYWVQQIRKPVRFASAMEALSRENIDLFVEIGPRGTLLAFGQDGWPGGESDWLPSLRPGRGDWAQMLDVAGRAWVRGASVNWRRVHSGIAGPPVALPTYPFERQRHWFDELGVAAPAAIDEADLEWAVSTLRSDAALSDADRDAAPRILAAYFRRQMQRATGESLRDALYELRWNPQPRAAGATPAAAGAWLVVGPLGPAAALLAEELHRRGQTAQLSNDFVPGSWRGIVFVAGPGAAPEAECLKLLAIVQAVLLAPAAAARLWVVTQGAVPAAPGDAEMLELAQASLWGFGRVVALEHPEMWGGLVDLPGTEGMGAIGALADELLGPDGEDQVALRPGARLVQRLVRRDLPKSAGLHLRADATYWVTGGLGALGLQVARWLVHHGARQLMLTGRSALSGAAEPAIEELRAAGARVLTLQADTAEPGDVNRALAEAADALGLVRGIVHCAGLSAADPLESLTPAGIEHIMRPKVAGAWTLHEGTRGLDLDFFVLFSSIAAVWGAKNQAHYAAANHFLDALAHHRRAHGLTALSVNWGPWAGEGMASGEAGAWLARCGVAALPAEEALAALDVLLGGGVTQAVVARVDWRVFRELFELRGPRPLLACLAPESAAAETATHAVPALAVVEMQAAPAAERRPRLVSLLQGEAGAVLGFRDGRLPDTRKGFFALGMDSLMAVELRNRLARIFACKLPATLAFDHANIEVLADHLGATVFGWTGSAGTDASPGAPAEHTGSGEAEFEAALAARLARLEALARKA